MSSKSILNKVNNIATTNRKFKPNLRIVDMVIGESYKVLSIKLISTIYGDKFVAELEEYSLFLPKVYDPAIITEEEFKIMLKKPTHIKIKLDKSTLEFTQEEQQLFTADDDDDDTDETFFISQEKYMDHIRHKKNKK